MKEIWKTISAFNGLYMVSNLGRIYSKESRKMLKPAVNQNGYAYVILCQNGTDKCLRVHRVVAEAFCVNPDNKPDVNHIDGSRLNNRADNLEWVTESENAKHALNVLGRNVGDAKIVTCLNKKTGEQKEFRSIRAASEYYGISYTHANRMSRTGKETNGLVFSRADINLSTISLV